MEVLTLSDMSKPALRVHATAVLSILHGAFRSSGKVVGALTGSVKDDTVEIFDAFQIPSGFDEDGVKIDDDYLRKMIKSHVGSFGKESLIGWYTTSDGDLLDSVSAPLNAFFCQFSRRPVHIVVNTSLSSSNISVHGFYGRQVTGILSKNNNWNPVVFENLVVDVVMSDFEAACLHQMISAHKSVIRHPISDSNSKIMEDEIELVDARWSSIEIAAPFAESSSQIKSSLRDLLEVVDKLQEYVNDVVEGKVQAHSDIGIALSDILGQLDAVSSDDVASLVHSRNQEISVIQQLTNLSKSLLESADRMNISVNI